MSYFTGLNTQQSADLLAVLAEYNAGNIATTATIQAAIAQQSANFAAFPLFIEVEITSTAPATATIQRRGKLSYNELTFSGAATSLDLIAEGTTFEDGDIVIMKPKTGKTITLNTLDTTIRLSQAGHYLAIIRAGGAWSVLASNPTQPLFSGISATSTQVILVTDTSFTPESGAVILTCTDGGTAAHADYEIDGAAGTDGTLSLYVDFNLIATATYTAATTIDLLGAAVVAGALPDIPFSLSYNIGTNRITITDTANLGAAGNSLSLSDAYSGGASGFIFANFSGGVDGIEGNPIIDTIGAIAEGRQVNIFNNMSGEKLTFASGGNILAGAGFDINPQEWGTFFSFNGLKWSVRY